MRITARMWLWSLPIVLAAGCASREATALVAVSGKVSYHGQLVHKGLIVFTPDADQGTVGTLVWAEIAADGSYRLKTEDKPGIAAGWYRITVSSVEPGVAIPGQPRPEPRSLLPDKYRDPDLSGLTCEVKSGRDNNISFNLE